MTARETAQAPGDAGTVLPSRTAPKIKKIKKVNHTTRCKVRSPHGDTPRVRIQKTPDSHGVSPWKGESAWELSFKARIARSNGSGQTVTGSPRERGPQCHISGLPRPGRQDPAAGA